ncbi:MAG: extracellular solute-binding protein [Bdellovibrionota bacterium]
MRNILIVLFTFTALFSCTKKNDKPEIWIYTSLYKDTIADIQPKLEQKFPGIKFNFFQAGSEEVASKVNAEELAGGTKADLLIFSDRFWFEEMAQKNRLHKYVPKGAEKVSATFRNTDGWYATVSHPIMVLAYNTDVLDEKSAPKTFKEMADPKWKNKFTTGSPLASGTNFTTVAFLQKSYGWDYYKALRKNDTIAEGGNSSVMRRVQTKERPVGWVLLENILRLPEGETKVKVIYPEDGAVIQTNILAIVANKAPRDSAQEVADWMFSTEGQEAMVRSHMHGSVPGIAAPKGAPTVEELIGKTSFKWSNEIVQEFMKNRESLKEEFAKIMLQ